MNEPRESDVYKKQIELGDGKTASLRFADLNESTAIICRFDWPHRDGIVIPIESIKEDTDCSHENCSCKEASALEATINRIKLCANCVKEIHNKIKSFIDTKPHYPLSQNI